MPLCMEGKGGGREDCYLIKGLKKRPPATAPRVWSSLPSSWKQRGAATFPSGSHCSHTPLYKVLTPPLITAKVNYVLGTSTRPMYLPIFLTQVNFRSSQIIWLETENIIIADSTGCPPCAINKLICWGFQELSHREGDNDIEKSERAHSK